MHAIKILIDYMHSSTEANLLQNIMEKITLFVMHHSIESVIDYCSRFVLKYNL